MLLLSLCWLLLGAFIGALALAANRRPGSCSWSRWWMLLVIGALSALLAGWLGTFLLGTYIATAVALWVAVFAVIMPSIILWARAHILKML